MEVREASRAPTVTAQQEEEAAGSRSGARRGHGGRAGPRGVGLEQRGTRPANGGLEDGGPAARVRARRVPRAGAALPGRGGRPVEPRPADAAARAGAGGRGRAALPGVHDSPRRAVPQRTTPERRCSNGSRNGSARNISSSTRTATTPRRSARWRCSPGHAGWRPGGGCWTWRAGQAATPAPSGGGGARASAWICRSRCSGWPGASPTRRWCGPTCASSRSGPAAWT